MRRAITIGQGQLVKPNKVWSKCFSPFVSRIMKSTINMLGPQNRTVGVCCMCFSTVISATHFTWRRNLYTIQFLFRSLLGCHRQGVHTQCIPPSQSSSRVLYYRPCVRWYMTGPVVVVDMVSHRTIRWEKDLSVCEYNPRRRSVYPLCCHTAFVIFHGGELLPA